MSINIDLGAWNSIFAVPSKVVDEGLKFSDGVKLKVLLFVLRNAGSSFDESEISKATGVNVTDIPEALDYWVSMG
ncbi:MAG: DNA replication protein DnaD, partial [Ruminococcus bromii]